MADRIQLRIDRHDFLVAENPLLAQGEPIVAIFPDIVNEDGVPVHKMKLGTGIPGKTNYNDIPFIDGQGGIRGPSGKNAYVTIVEAGLFTGTIEEWYESLKGGPKGDPGKTPTIGANENWWIDGIDTGHPTKGSTPLVGLNGNWWIDGKDTGHPSQGIKGDKGEDGTPFRIDKYFPSIAAMEADNNAGLIPNDTYIAITNSSENDPDNGKLYYRNNDGELKYLYKFADISAAKGDKGDKGNTGPAVSLRKYGGYIQSSSDEGVTWKNLVALDELKPSTADQPFISRDDYNAIFRGADGGWYVSFPQVPITDPDGNPITSIVKWFLSNPSSDWSSNFVYPTKESSNGSMIPARSTVLGSHIVKRVNFPDGLVQASDNMYIQISLNQRDWFTVPFTVGGATIANFDGDYGLGIEAVDSKSVNFVIGRGPNSTKPWDFNFWWRICIEKFMNVIVQYPSKGILTELNDVDIDVDNIGLLRRDSAGIVKTVTGMLVPDVPEGMTGTQVPTLKAIDGHPTWDLEPPNVMYSNIEGLVPSGTVVSAPTINGVATYMSVDHTTSPKRVRAYSNWKRSNGHPYFNNQSYKTWAYSLFDETSSWCFPVWNNDWIGYRFTSPTDIDQIIIQFMDQLELDPFSLPLRFEIQYSLDGLTWLTDSVQTFGSRTYRIILNLAEKRTDVVAIRVVFSNFNIPRYNYAWVDYMRIGFIEGKNEHYRGQFALKSALDSIDDPQENDFADVSETSSEWQYIFGPNQIYVGEFDSESDFPTTGIADGYIADNLTNGNEWYFDQNNTAWKDTENPIGTTPHTTLNWYNSKQPIGTTPSGVFQNVVKWSPFAVLPEWNYSHAPLIINFDAGHDDGGQRSVIKNYGDEVLDGEITTAETQYVYAKYNVATDTTELLCQNSLVLESDTGSRMYDAGNITARTNTIASVGYHSGYTPQGAFNGGTGSGVGDSWISATTAGDSNSERPCVGAWIGQQNLVGSVYQIQFLNRDANYAPSNIIVEISLDGVQWSTLCHFITTTQAGSAWNTINLPDYAIDSNVPHSIRLRALDSGPNNRSWRINEIYMRARRYYDKNLIIYNTRKHEYRDGYGSRYYLQFLGRITASNEFEKNIGIANNYIVDSSSENSASALATYNTSVRWRTNQKNTNAYFGIKNIKKPINCIQWYTFTDATYCVSQVTVEIQRDNNPTGTWEFVGVFNVSKTANTTITIRPDYECDTDHCIRVRSSGASIDWIVFWAKFFEKTSFDSVTHNRHFQLHGQQCLSDYIETDWFAVGVNGTYTFFNSLGTSDIDVEVMWRATNAAGYENACTVEGYQSTTGAGIRVTAANIYVYTGSNYTYYSRYTSSSGGYYKLIAKRRKNLKDKPL